MNVYVFVRAAAHISYQAHLALWTGYNLGYKMKLKMWSICCGSLLFVVIAAATVIADVEQVALETQ